MLFRSALDSPSGYSSWWNNITTAPVFQSDATLPRNGWIATASNRNELANNAIDGNPASRWDTGMAQAIGQWFSVDTRQPVKFNMIILDTSGSSNDWPSAYAVHISSDGSNWGEPIAAGSQQASVLMIKLPEAITTRYIRIRQTGTGKTNYWSIHEFYLALVDEEEELPPPPPPSNNEMNIAETLNIFIDNKTVYISGYENIQAKALIRVFTATGHNVQTTGISGNGISLERLPAGMYIVTLQDGNRVLRSWKILLAN